MTLWVHPTLTLWKIRLRAWVTVICVFVRGGVRLEPRRHCYRQNCCCRSNHHHTRRGYITPARYCCHQRIPKRERARLVWYVLGYWVGLYLVVELHLEKAIRRWGERRIKKQTGKKRKVFLYFFFFIWKGRKKWPRNESFHYQPQRTPRWPEKFVDLTSHFPCSFFPLQSQRIWFSFLLQSFSRRAYIRYTQAMPLSPCPKCLRLVYTRIVVKTREKRRN